MKPIKFIFVTIIFAILNFQNSECARILGVFPIAGASHFNMLKTIMLGLAERGHQVDVISHFPQNKKIHERYHDISIRGTMPITQNNFTVEEIVNDHGNNYNLIKFMFDHFGSMACKNILGSKPIQDLIKSKPKYDAIIFHAFGSDCYLALSHYFGDSYTIGVVTSVNMPWFNDRFGNPDNPSYIPVFSLPYTSKMNFFERLYNSITLLAMKLAYQYYAVPRHNQIVKETLGPNTPDLDVFQEKMNLILLNSHFSINTVRPMSPSVIEVAGLHIKSTSKKLEEKFEKIMNSSKNGVIVFSLGSMIRTETFTDETKKGLMRAFEKLKYDVVWKADPDFFQFENIPKNIHFEKWIPQFDLLCHPKAKLFITHGGQLGTQEALYCGVPLLGIPLFIDQKLNINHYIDLGVAQKLNHDEINEEKMTEKLNTLLSTNQYIDRVKELSAIFHERPQTALETAMFWIEYVIKFKGASHLKPYGSKLPWYKLYLIDIILTILLAIFTICYLVLKLIRRFRGSKKSSKQKVKKN